MTSREPRRRMACGALPVAARTQGPQTEQATVSRSHPRCFPTQIRVRAIGTEPDPHTTKHRAHSSQGPVLQARSRERGCGTPSRRAQSESPTKLPSQAELARQRVPGPNDVISGKPLEVRSVEEYLNLNPKQIG